jgi:hypothetical protein
MIELQKMYDCLSKAGYTKEWLLEYVLPDWWKDYELDAEGVVPNIQSEFAFRMSRHLGLNMEKLWMDEPEVEVVKEVIKSGDNEISMVTDNTVRLYFYEPILVKMYKENDLWICEYPHCGIIGHHKDMITAWFEFQQDFCLIWFEYAKEDDDKLTTDAIALKKKLRDLVEQESFG